MLMIIIKTISAIFVSYFFAIMFNVQGRRIIFASLAGGICWFIYDILVYLGKGETVAYFTAAVILTIYSEILAKKEKAPITSFLIVGLIPIVPGGGIYYTLFHILNKNIVAGTEKGIETFLLSGALAFGILFVSSIYAVYNRMNQRDVKYIMKKISIKK